MISFSPDVILTIIWCVFGILERVITFNSEYFRVISIILIILLTRKKMKLSTMHIVCIIFCIYFYIIGAYHEGIVESVRSSISMISWVATLFVYTSYSKTQKDLRTIFNFIIYTGLLVAIIFLIDNELFSNTVFVRLHNDPLVNRNSIILYIFPAYLLQLIKIERSDKRKMVDIIIYSILLFTCIQINSRAMYSSLIISTLLVFNKKVISLIKKGKIFGLLIFILFLVFATYFVFTILPDEYVVRIFNGKITTGESRLDLWKEAIGLVKNPLLGMGPSYYSSHVSYSFADYGSHNIFIDLYVSAGIISALLFAIIFIFFYKKNMYILSMIIPVLITFMVESGRKYFPYMLLMIVWFICEGAKKEEVSIDQYIGEIINGKK